MGRVSRIIKAASDSRGENPSNGQEKGGDRDLPRVIAAWMRMPEHHRRTVMTLVELTENKRERSE